MAQPALALSCLRPDVARTFNEAAASETTYVVVHGALHFDAAEMPQTDMARTEPDAREVSGTIEGKGLTVEGFTVPFVRDLVIEAECLGSWCPTVEPGAEVLAFLERSKAGYRLHLTPCGGMAFQAPEPADLDRVVACYQGSACDEAG
ncbi:hypothetical protein [Pseudooceanicola sp.]|uniref:hypothetical protein n=1 Tax=Pseudooceanicola sp. TaxID=1914328 RepID=UPI0040596BCC